MESIISKINIYTLNPEKFIGTEINGTRQKNDRRPSILLLIKLLKRQL